MVRLLLEAYYEPRFSGRSHGFRPRRGGHTAILPPWARKTPQVADVLPLLYLHGLSSGDFAPALGQFLGSPAACPPR